MSTEISHLYHNKIVKYYIFINIFLLVTLPQLNNIHYDPSPAFWGQMLFAWISLALIFISLMIVPKITLPWIIYPLLLFTIYLAIQPYITFIPFIGISYTAILEMILCIFLAISINSIKTTYSMQMLLKYLCVALVFGATLQSLIGAIQYFNFAHYFQDIIFYDSTHPTTNIFGHFGQRNHYCHYLTWGLSALIYLFYNKSINKYLFSFLLILIVFAITISASRSAFLYLITIEIIILIYYLYNTNKENFKLLILCTLSLILLIFFEYSIPFVYKYLHVSNTITSGLTRISNEQNEIGRRLIEWQKAIMIFTMHPFYGVGLFGYAYQGVILNSKFINVPLNSGLFVNCHNLILQLLAETGLFATLIIIFGIIYSIKKLIHNISHEKLIILCMLSTTIIHSMLEYPLWYLYFLGIFIIFLSLDSPVLTIRNNMYIKILVSILVTIFLYISISCSIIFNQLVAYNDAPNNSELFIKQAKIITQIANNNLLMEYLAIFSLDNYLIIDNKLTNKAFSLNEQYYYIKKFTDFQPYPDSLIKLAKLEYKRKNSAEALRLITLAINAFPLYKQSLLNSLNNKQYHSLYILVSKVSQ